MGKKKLVLLGILFSMAVCLSAPRLWAGGSCSDTTTEPTDATNEEILSEFDPSQQILLDGNFYLGDVPSQIDSNLLQSGEKGPGAIGDLPDTFNSTKKPPKLVDGKPSKYSDENGDWYWGIDGHLYPWPPPGLAVPQSKVTRHPDGKVTTKYPDGRTETKEPDGTIKTWYPNGTFILQYPDGFTATVLPNGRVINKKTTKKGHMGKTVTEYPEGKVVTTYSDGTTQTDYYTDGRSVTQYPDGKKVTRYPDNKVIIEHTDGRTETQYPNGRTETKYPDGRIETKEDDTPIQIDGINQGVMKLDIPPTEAGTASDADSVADDLQPSVSASSPDPVDEALGRALNAEAEFREKAERSQESHNIAEERAKDLSKAIKDAMDAEPGSEEAKEAARRVEEAAKAADYTEKQAQKEAKEANEAMEKYNKAMDDLNKAREKAAAGAGTNNRTKP